MSDEFGSPSDEEGSDERFINVIGAIDDTDIPPEEGMISVLMQGTQNFAKPFIDGSYTEGIIEGINEDKAAGNLNRIFYVLVSTAIFGRLIEEGTVSVFHLQESVAQEGFLFVVPKVTFGEYIFPLKVASAEALENLIGDYSCATMTEDNEFV